VAKRIYPMTEWGRKTTDFRMRYGMSVADLCSKSGACLSSYHAVTIGKTVGIETVELIDAFIAKTEATQKPPQVQQFSQLCT